MTDVERRTAAARFAADWKGRGDEKQETSLLWISLMHKRSIEHTSDLQ